MLLIQHKRISKAQMKKKHLILRARVWEQDQSIYRIRTLDVTVASGVGLCMYQVAGKRLHVEAPIAENSSVLESSIEAEIMKSKSLMIPTRGTPEETCTTPRTNVL